MDALYSLRSRRASRDSVESFDVLSHGDSSEQQHGDSSEQQHGDAHAHDTVEFDSESDAYDDDDWEVLSDDSSSSSNSNSGDYSAIRTAPNDANACETSTAMESIVHVHDSHFDLNAKAPSEPECEPELEPASESGPRCGGTPATLPQPQSKALLAKETLRAFYLARAMEAEAKHKAIVVTRPQSPRCIATPPSHTAILPLKAPARYSVAVQEAAIQTANTQRATAALEQFYRARALAKKTRAARNRVSEAELIASQSGRAALVRAAHSSAAAPTWDAVLTR